MTTNPNQEYLDLLRGLTAATLQENQAKADVFRPEGRWAPTDFEADTTVSVESRSGERQDGSEWSNSVVCLHFTNMKVNETFRNKGYEGTTGAYDISLPANLAKAGTNSQLGKTVESIAASTRDLSATIITLDHARVHYVEAVEPAPKGADGQPRKGRDGYALRPTFYYKVVSVTPLGAKANGKTPDSHAANLALLGFAVGKTPEQFKLNAAPYLASQGLKDDNLQLSVLNGTWLTEATMHRQLSVADDGTFVLGEIPAGAQ